MAQSLKEQAASLMGQLQTGEATPPVSRASSEEKLMVERMFLGKNPGEEVTESDRQRYRAKDNDDGTLLEASSESSQVFGREALLRQTCRRAGLSEDLVSQCAQALVKDKIDAFLAITGKMSPEEVHVALSTARDWRRPDEGWDEKYQAAPETGFSFIDTKPKKQAQSESLQVMKMLENRVAEWMTRTKQPVTYVPNCVEGMAKTLKLQLTKPCLETVVENVASRLTTS